MEQIEDEIACKIKDATAKTAGIDADILIAEKDHLTQDLNDLHAAVSTLNEIEETSNSLSYNNKRKEQLEKREQGASA